MHNENIFKPPNINIHVSLSKNWLGVQSSKAKHADSERPEKSATVPKNHQRF